MIYLSKLKPNQYYSPNTVVKMPERLKTPKKGVLFTVLAPSISAEFEYIAKTDYIKFSNLWRYVIGKQFRLNIFGHKNMKYVPNENGEITELLSKYNQEQNGNFSKIDTITTLRNTVKTDTIKGFNTLYEINYDFYDLIFKNGSDVRFNDVKIHDYFQCLSEAFLPIKNNAAWSTFHEKYLIIPLELWGDKSTYRIAKPSRKNSTFIQEFIQFIESSNDKFLQVFEGFTLVFEFENKWIRIEPNLIESPSEMCSIIKAFIKRISVGAQKSKKQIQEEEQALKEAKVLSAIDEELTQNFEKTNVDASRISDQKLEDLQASILVDINDDGVAIVTQGLDDAERNGNDAVISAKLEGKSLANYKRDEMLRKKYAELKIGDKTISSLLEHDASSEKLEDYTVDIDTINPDLKNIPSYNFSRAYNEELGWYDFAGIITHFASCNPPLYLVKDPQIKDISDTENRMLLCTLTYEDEMRKRHKFSFKMPTWYKDRYLRINGQQWNIIHQKMLFPVSKTEANLCQVSTNYNKIRMTRYGTNISSKTTKLRKLLLSDDGEFNLKSVQIEIGDNTSTNNIYPTTIEFDSLAEKLNKLKIGSLVVYFNMKDAITLIGMPSTNLGVDDSCIYPFALDNKSKTKYYISGASNIVYDHTGKVYGQFSDFIISVIGKYNEGFDKLFSQIPAGSKFIYTRAKILNKQVPLILILSAADPGGLRSVMDKAQIKYEFTKSQPRNVDYDNRGIIRFNDGFLVYDRYPYENSLLMNGLSVIPTREFNYFDMASRETYIDIFDILFASRNLIDGIENFYYLLIDPITEDVLARIHQPTTFVELLLYANAKLSDNSYRLDADYFESRIRSNEILNVFLYQEMCKAYAMWKIGKSPTFSIPEDAIIKRCMESNIIESHTKLNTVLELENERQIKLKGPGGMNEDRSFTLDKRAFHPSMMGIVGMNSVPSGEVGINRHLTLNANITNPRGFVMINKGRDEYNGTELNTPGELLNTFATESADIERVAMAITQSKHLVPTEPSQSLVSYDMERLLPHISTDFSFPAKHNGKVIEIKEDIMIVQYENGMYDDIDLGETVDKNTDGGFFIVNRLKTDLKVGDKFKKHDVLAYNPMFINEKDEFGDYCSSVGTLARVAIISNGNVYEDSGEITERFAERAATKITKEKAVLISPYANIKRMVNIGDEVLADDPLIIFDDTKDEFTSQMLQSMASNLDDEDELLSSSMPVTAKFGGVVKDIKIYYTIPVEEMSPSLQKLIKKYNANIKRREDVISKYIPQESQNTILYPSKPVTPDSSGRVNGKKIGNNVKIFFYIETYDIAGIADKFTNYTAIKMTICRTIPKGLEPFTKFNPTRKVDVTTSAIGIYKRMCLDIIKIGGIGKIMVSRKFQLRNKYLDRLKKEVKK